MPRYYFHTRNGRLALDDRGEEFSDVQTAREEALKVLGEMLRFGSTDFWSSRTFSVVVVDEGRRPVVTLTTTASEAFPEGWERPSP